MAIWQYQLFIIPKEEINSYFENSEYIDKGALDEINWWKFRAFEKVAFENFRKVLKQKKKLVSRNSPLWRRRKQLF